MPEQNNWRWCHRCQGLSYAGHGYGWPCPSGGKHNPGGSWDYILTYDEPPAGGQNNWRWGSQCQGLVFAGHPHPWPCPGGGEHNLTVSFDYILRHDEPPAGRQNNWRWCSQCQGLVFAGNANPKPCPGGGEHNLTVSFDYILKNDPSNIAPYPPQWCCRVSTQTLGGGWHEAYKQTYESQAEAATAANYYENYFQGQGFVTKQDISRGEC